MPSSAEVTHFHTQVNIEFVGSLHLKYLRRYNPSFNRDASLLRTARLTVRQP